MKKYVEPAPGSFEAAEHFQLKLALRASYAQRLRDLQEMIDFNSQAEAMNPRLKETSRRLRQ